MPFLDGVSESAVGSVMNSLLLGDVRIATVDCVLNSPDCSNWEPSVAGFLVWGKGIVLRDGCAAG